MTDEPKTKFLTEFDKTEPLAIMQIYMKTYAACRHTHPAIEAALTLKKKYNLNPLDIVSIEVEAYKLAVAGHNHIDILGVSSAKMSLPFSVALALCTGSAGMESFNEDNVTDETILALTRKITVLENEELSSWVPQKRASIIHITLADGQKLTHRVDYPKGEPENPLTNKEIEDKFISLALASGFTMERCKDILQTIQQPTFKLKNLLQKLN
jgi:2-methylcitrate dehydratase PrpD